MEKSETRVHAVERLEAARETKDWRSTQHDAATGSSNELSARAELQAADEQFAAREAWLKWTETDY